MDLAKTTHGTASFKGFKPSWLERWKSSLCSANTKLVFEVLPLYFEDLNRTPQRCLVPNVLYSPLKPIIEIQGSETAWSKRIFIMVEKLVGGSSQVQDSAKAVDNHTWKCVTWYNV